MKKMNTANLKHLWMILAVLSLALNPLAEAQKQGDNSAGLIPGQNVSKDGKTTFAQALPEDINDENFGLTIESFDYPNADISEVVKAISKLTGKNFILEKGLSGKISIIAPSRITVAEAYKAFLTALAMNGFTIVPSGSFLKIRAIQNAAKESIDTYAGNYFPNTDQLITRIVKLKYINAEEVQKTLRPIINQSGDITPYAPTNSLIVTDLGSNIERITNIINQLDVPGFEEKLVVIPIRNARAKDMADLIDQIINKGQKQNNQFGTSIPRFRTGTSSTSGSGSGAANYSLVIPDLRTNSIIVVGNDAGIERIRSLVQKLDFRIRPEDGGGVWVYYVRHGEAEKIANVLNGIASESTKSKTQATNAIAAPGGPPGSAPTAPTSAVFGGDVKVAPDKDNNSLIVTASKQDYEMVRTILSKIDIPRDQVYVKTIIMEMDASNKTNWGVNYFKFDKDSGGLGRLSFATSRLSDFQNPIADQGLTLGFGSGSQVELNIAGQPAISVPSLLALVRFIKSNSGGNILSTPQILALDNEDAEIEVGEDVPIGLTVSNTQGAGSAQQVDRKELTLKLKITPFISPDTDVVRMKVDQKIKSLSQTQVQASELQDRAVAFKTRSVVTSLIVNSDDTAVLGGLMEDQETESVAKIPILGDIPILGWLFKSKESDVRKKNLMIFITPKILRNSQDNADLLNVKLNERIDFIQKNMKGRDPHGSEIDKLPRRSLLEETKQDFVNEPDPMNNIPSADNNTPLPETESNGDAESPAKGPEDGLPGDYEEGE